VFVSFVSFLTAYYIFREGFVMFYGPERHKEHFEEEPHEAPSVMLVPMVVLAIGSAVVGFFEGWYMSALRDHKEMHVEIAISSVVISLLGIGLAYLVFVKRVLDPEKLYQSLKPVHTTFREQFFTERLYHKGFAEGYMKLSRGLFLAGDRFLIDGFINLLNFLYFRVVKFLWIKLDIYTVDLFVHGVAKFSFRFGRKASLIQTGLLNNYVAFLLFGLVVLLGIIIYFMG
jgi:NADH-quinone oxidoreductase subunit L